MEKCCVMPCSKQEFAVEKEHPDAISERGSGRTLHLAMG
jgi:hypothetical protein